MTTLLDAVPQYIVVYPGPSYLPLLLTIGISLLFVGTLVKNWWLAALSVPISIVILIYWNWPRREEERGFPAAREEQTRGLPVDVSDSRATGWWGMMLLLLCHAVIFGAFIVSYFYLAGNNPVWPPTGVPLPEPSLAIGATVLAIAAAAASRVALRGIERGDQGQLTLGLAVAVLIGLASVVVSVMEIMRQPFGLDESAYTSSFTVILALMALQAALALVFLLVVLVWAWQGYYSLGRYLAVRNVSLYWIYVTGAWLVVLATIYASPHFLGLS